MTALLLTGDVEKIERSVASYRGVIGFGEVSVSGDSFARETGIVGKSDTC